MIKVYENDKQKIKSNTIIHENKTLDKVLTPKILFKSTNGTNGNIDLSDNYENYKYLDIVHTGGTTRYYTDCVDKAIVLLGCANDSLTLIHMMKRLRITSRKLTIEHAGRSYSYGTTPYNDDMDYLYIFKIIGYK